MDNVCRITCPDQKPKAPQLLEIRPRNAAEKTYHLLTWRDVAQKKGWGKNWPRILQHCNENDNNETINVAQVEDSKSGHFCKNDTQENRDACQSITHYTERYRNVLCDE